MKPLNSRRSEFSTIGESISDMLKSLRMEKKFDQMSVVGRWADIMGETVASRSEKVFFKDETLYVKLNSAPLKHQLSLSKTKVMALLNEAFEKELVKDLVFL